MASKNYRKIVDFLEHEISLRGEQEDERKSLLQAGRLNLVMCHLKREEWIEARNICDKVSNDRKSHCIAIGIKRFVFHRSLRRTASARRPSSAEARLS